MSLNLTPGSLNLCMRHRESLCECAVQSWHFGAINLCQKPQKPQLLTLLVHSLHPQSTAAVPSHDNNFVRRDGSVYSCRMAEGGERRRLYIICVGLRVHVFPCLHDVASVFTLQRVSSMYLVCEKRQRCLFTWK